MTCHWHDSLYTSATTATEMTPILKEMQIVSERVARNKLVLNIKKLKA
jgi:hypothetical protein